MITSISYDHQQQLGNTLTEIASEKAGIIKPGVPVVTGATDPEAAHVISNIAKERGCKLRQLGKDFTVSRSGQVQGKEEKGKARQRFTFQNSLSAWSNGHSRNNIALRLLGNHQLSNAAVVLAGLDILREHGWNISESAIEAGLATTQVPGRIEIVAEHPTTVVDTAHNEASISALIATLDENFRNQKRIAVFSASRDKKCFEMLELLMKSFQEIILTQFHTNPRAQSAESLLAMANVIHRSNPAIYNAHYSIEPTSASAIKTAQQIAAPNDLIVATGSFFLAAELLPEFRE